ncbi:MAG: putative bifunctional diguanylate cyclase/phosphodiesterase [Anaerovoracaceae bacterium]
MDNDNRFINKPSDSKVIFFIMLLFEILMAVALNYILGRNFKIGEQILMGSTISGLIMLLQLLVSIYMVLNYNSAGFIACEIVSVLSMFVVIIKFIVTAETNVIPCIGISFCTILILIILYVYEVHSNKAADMLRMQAKTDYLTGAYNRKKLLEDIEADVELEKSKGLRERFALVILNLDDFKRINEVRGHECGDDVLIEVTRRWKEKLSKDDSLYRISGDEFAIIFRRYMDYKSFEHRLRNITDVLQNPILTDRYENYLTVSCGIVKCPENSEDVDVLLSYGLAALNDARRTRGQSRRMSMIKYFNDQILKTITRELYVCDIIRKSVDEDLLWIMYQPQYKSQNCMLHGFEALLRMKNLQGEIISPMEFIPIAEKHGLIWKLGSWVLKNAMLSFNKSLGVASDDLRDLKISVNVSSIQLLSGYFVETCRTLIEDCKFDPKNLVIEITESVLIDSPDKAIDTINQLHDLGISFSIDDFGTGFSSMSYLQCLPIDEMKIDKSFIDNIATDSKNREFVNMMVYVGHQLDLKVVAEGVEDEEQYNIFRDMNVDLIQGYYFSKPVEYKDMNRMMNNSYC